MTILLGGNRRVGTPTAGDLVVSVPGTRRNVRPFLPLPLTPNVRLFLLHHVPSCAPPSPSPPLPCHLMPPATIQTLVLRDPTPCNDPLAINQHHCYLPCTCNDPPYCSMCVIPVRLVVQEPIAPLLDREPRAAAVQKLCSLYIKQQELRGRLKRSDLSDGDF